MKMKMALPALALTLGLSAGPLIPGIEAEEAWPRIQVGQALWLSPNAFLCIRSFCIEGCCAVV
jgi:hypothetical protein